MYFDPLKSSAGFNLVQYIRIFHKCSILYYLRNIMKSSKSMLIYWTKMNSGFEFSRSKYKNMIFELKKYAFFYKPVWYMLNFIRSLIIAIICLHTCRIRTTIKNIIMFNRFCFSINPSSSYSVIFIEIFSDVSYRHCRLIVW